MKFLKTVLLATCMCASLPVLAQEFEVDEDSFIEGNLYFIMYHELGHALVSEFELTVLGREEDAVDRLATWMMTPEDDSDEEPDYLKGAIQGWFMSAAERPLDTISWWGQHGTDQQRAYQISCLLYGYDAESYGAIADSAKLPEDRRTSCESEAADNDTAWTKVLEPHQQGDDPTKEKEVVVNYSYEATTTFAAEKEYVEGLEILEDITKFMAETYRFKPGITVQAAECGEPNAYWNGGTRTITLCYELVADYRRMAEML